MALSLIFPFLVLNLVNLLLHTTDVVLLDVARKLSRF